MRQFSLILIVLPVVLAAQELPTIKIAEVSVEGNDRASATVIRSTMGLVAGRSVTALDIQRGIRRLWDLGFFGDVQVYLDEETAEGSVLRIQVTEYPSLESVEYEGNRKISKNKIKEAIELEPPKILSANNIAEAVRKLRALYHKDGYLNVAIDTELRPGRHEHGRILVFKIEEHKKLRLRGITFDGNEYYSNFRLSRQLKETKRWHWYTFWRTPFDRKKFEEDLQALTTFYLNNGYRDIRILSDTVIYTPNGKGLKIVINIDEGRIYHYRNFTWEGNTLHDDERLAAALRYEKGDTYNKDGFAEAVAQRVHPVYMDEGYLYSRVEPVEYPVGEDSVDVVFNIVENQKVAVRYINIAGNDRTRDYVVRRELRINPGETFSYERLGRSQRDVWILNYFDNVEPNVLPVDEDEVDLSIKVTERSTERANLSLGYTQQYGFIGGGGVEFNNLMGTGQKLSLSYNRGSSYGFSSLASARRTAYQSLSISLVNPWLLNTPNLVGISAFYSERGQAGGQSYYLPFDIEQKGGSIRWGRRFRWPDSFFRGSWMFQASDKRYIGDESVLSGYFSDITVQDLKKDSKGRTYIATVGMAFTTAITRDSRNRPEFPTMGSEFSWVSTLSGIGLGGNEDFHKHVLAVKWYVPLIDKFVFYHMTKMGMIKQVKDQSGRSILPPEEKFYLGGSGIPFGEMLRGYPDNSVGPYISGRPLGARTMFKYSAELRFSLSENPTVYVLAFTDLGNSWEDFSHVDPFQLKRSVGFGVRMFMPMLGMLGLDMGYGFDPAGATLQGKPHGWEMHFLFGQPF
ncbi:MAG: outer membrane protein assembly factor BamA [Candidatus Marinimicrobia bacterium]|nr:outer membrane protein assembly factor BamA [Candidatus Neomarinimicrobiota bacterium]